LKTNLVSEIPPRSFRHCVLQPACLTNGMRPKHVHGCRMRCHLGLNGCR
jgi:hypothetical protein